MGGKVVNQSGTRGGCGHWVMATPTALPAGLARDYGVEVA